MVEVSTVFHRHQLPHQANYRAWGSHTATHLGGFTPSMVPIYALATVTAAPVVATGAGYAVGGALAFAPGLDAFLAAYFTRKQIFPNVVKGIAALSVPATAANLYKFGPVIVDKVRQAYEDAPPHFWPDDWKQSRGDQGGSLPSTLGVEKSGSIGSPSAPRIGARSTGRGVPSFRRGRASRAPYCRIHKKRHWCKYTRK